jgi:predicted alpha/beta hydrolase family esterase
MSDSPQTTGITANGVPFVAVPSLTSGAPVVVIWHLLDPPRSPAAMAAAIPLAGLDATRIYLGLPMSGDREPEGGTDAIMALLARDAPALVHGPIFDQAVAEFPEAFADLRERLSIPADAVVGLVGGSMGSAVAAGVLAAGTSGAKAAVLVSPMMQLREMIDEVAPMFGGYTWSADSDAVAARMDFVARAPEVIAAGADIRVVLGLDDADGMIGPARAFATATGADLHELDGVGHGLADEPGTDPAPQTDAAQRVDALTVEWLRARL